MFLCFCAVILVFNSWVNAAPEGVEEKNQSVKKKQMINVCFHKIDRTLIKFSEVYNLHSYVLTQSIPVDQTEPKAEKIFSIADIGILSGKNESESANPVSFMIVNGYRINNKFIRLKFG